MLSRAHLIPEPRCRLCVLCFGLVLSSGGLVPSGGAVGPVPSPRAVMFFLKLTQFWHPVWGNGTGSCWDHGGTLPFPSSLLLCPCLSLTPRQQPGIGPSAKGAAPLHGCCLHVLSRHGQGGGAQPKALVLPEIALGTQSFPGKARCSQPKAGYIHPNNSNCKCWHEF